MYYLWSFDPQYNTFSLTCRGCTHQSNTSFLYIAFKKINAHTCLGSRGARALRLEKI